ncbi:MAG: glycosyltransferase [Planctomycetota bacterium]
MKIALCSYEVAGLRGGGIGTYVFEAARALSQAGHEVWLLTSRQGVAAGELEAWRARVPVHGVVFVEDGERGGAAQRAPRFGLARHTLRFAELVHRALREQHQQAPFDYIEFPDYGAWGSVAVAEQRFFGSYGDAVLAVVLHSPTHECFAYNDVLHVLPPTERETAVLEEQTIRRAPLVWSPSMRLREMVAERLSLAPDFAEIVRYPMLPAAAAAAATAAGAAAPPPTRARESLAELNLLYFGRIEPRKGVRQLVQAFRELPDLSIECVGRDGDTSPTQTSEIEHLRRMGASNVTFSPPLPRERMLERLRQADVVILPSPWENWPNTCIEAMAQARVVVGGKNGGMGEMIEHGESGFVCDGSDPADIVRVLREDVAAALPRLDQIGQKAAARIRELSDPARYVEAIERLVAEQRRAGSSRLPIAAANAQPIAAPHAGAPRVSVVTPFYREDLDVVRAAIESALAQTHPVHEIVVCEDGSPRPDKGEILRSLAALDERVRILHKDNGGLARARNYALEHVQGDVVLFLDADNLLRPDYVELGLDVLRRCPDAYAVLGRHQRFDDGGEPGAAGSDAGVVVQPLPYDRPLALFRNSLGDAGAMLRREVFTEHGLRFDPDVDVYSDWALWLDMARHQLAVEIVPRVLYDYRVRRGSLMDEHAWDRHLPMLGRLIRNHLPPAAAAPSGGGSGRDASDAEASDAEREMLVQLAQGWGVGAIAATLSGYADSWERPAKVARRLQPGHTRYQFGEGLGKLLEKVPPLHRIAHWTMARLLRAHGRRKERRRQGGLH